VKGTHAAEWVPILLQHFASHSAPPIQKLESSRTDLKLLCVCWHLFTLPQALRSRGAPWGGWSPLEIQPLETAFCGAVHHCGHQLPLHLPHRPGLPLHALHHESECLTVQLAPTLCSVLCSRALCTAQYPTLTVATNFNEVSTLQCGATPPSNCVRCYTVLYCTLYTTQCCTHVLHCIGVERSTVVWECTSCKLSTNCRNSFQIWANTHPLLKVSTYHTREDTVQ